MRRFLLNIELIEFFPEHQKKSSAFTSRQFVFSEKADDEDIKAVMRGMAVTSIVDAATQEAILADMEPDEIERCKKDA